MRVDSLPERPLTPADLALLEEQPAIERARAVVEHGSADRVLVYQAVLVGSDTVVALHMDDDCVWYKVHVSDALNPALVALKDLREGRTEPPRSSA
jgi:hypothetical protein